MNWTDQPIRHTPLYDLHVAAGGKMVPFAGYALPVNYGSQIEEHLATRSSVGLFDVSHMGQIRVTGSGALELIQRVVTRDVAPLATGEQALAMMCRDDGSLIDDLYIARLGERDWLLVVNAGPYAGDAAYLEAEAKAMGGPPRVRVEPCSDQWAMIGVQGPKWEAACVAALGEGPWQVLARNRMLAMEFLGKPLLFSATGYTGESGCELLCSPDDAPELWRRLAAAGGRPAGLAARDTLRLEAGFCLSGQDFNAQNNPYEAGMGWVVQLDKAIAFRGQEALRRIRAEGPRRRLVGLLPEGRRIPRHGAAVLTEGRMVGTVTSGGFSPTLDRPIAFAYVDMPYAREAGKVEIDLGRTPVEASITRRKGFLPSGKS